MTSNGRSSNLNSGRSTASSSGINTSSRRFCKHCLIKQSSSISHCSICGVCIEEIDHHCVFFGGCIAKNNLASFNSTICMYVFSLFYFALLITLDALWAEHVPGSSRVRTETHGLTINGHSGLMAQHFNNIHSNINEAAVGLSNSGAS
jgi:hypothetical protein